MNGAAKNILVVDDNLTNRKMLAAILQAENFTTLEAADGAEALSLMDTKSVDAIISDILMPTMDGYRFCYEVRKSRRHSTLPFMFHSATYTSPADEELAFELGADRMFPKPVSAAVLLQSLHEVFTDPVYKRPRLTARPQTLEAIKEYRDALVAKLEEKTVELQKTTVKLKASEELFRVITENAADLIAVLDLHGRRIYTSPSCMVFFGGPEKIPGSDSFQDIYPDDRDRIRKAFLETVATGVGQRMEYRCVVGDGSVRYVESQSSVVRGSDGITERVVVVSRDITSRKRGEETLTKLSSAVEHAGDNIVITDRDGIIEYVNPSFERSSGFEKEFAIGKTPRILKSGMQDESFYEQLWKTVLSGHTFRGECINKKSNGELYYEEQTISPILDAGGCITHFVSSGKDVTEHRQMELEVNESEQRFRELTDAIKEVFWLTSPGKNELLYISRGFEEIWGRTRASLTSKSTSWAACIHPDDRNRILESAMPKQVLGTYDEEYRIVRPDGTIRWIHERAFPIRDGRGDVSRVAGVAEDITGRKSLEQQLRQAQKLEALGTLAGGIAHDFNNILGIIMGHSLLLGSREMDRERVAKSSDAITQASQRGAGLVRQLLNFARKTERALESVNVDDCITEIAKLLNETFPKTITVSHVPGEGIPCILADSNQLHHIILNLCVNARDAMPGGGTLTITTSISTHEAVCREFPGAGPTRYVCISSSDTGSGMDEMTRQRIFEPFFTTKGVGKGTGLGLAGVYGIVKSMNGQISVESSVGIGTTFRLYFPVVESDTLVFETTVEATGIRGGTETILVVEDEEMLMDLLASLLEEGGYRVLRATDGDEAVAVYKKHMSSISLVLTDFGLPRLDGHNAFLKMKQLNPRIRAIIASGYITPDQRSDIFLSGVREIIVKPYVPANVMRLIREVIDLKLDGGNGLHYGGRYPYPGD